MSTLMYGALTRKREEATPDTSTTSDAPGVRTYADALSALVPAEVLTTLAVLTPMFIDSKTADGSDDITTTITNVAALRISFWGLLIASMLLYVIGRIVGKTKTKFEGWDLVRPLIPAAAFMGWVMLQQPEIFERAVVGWSAGVRSVVAVLGGLVLGGVAAALAYKADQNPPGG